MTTDAAETVSADTADRVIPSGDWVDDVLLAGPDSAVCLRLDEPITRARLRQAVGERQIGLTAGGLRRGGTVALWLPPSWDFVATLLAVWRCGSQAILFDHRLTQHEVDGACARLLPQLLVKAKGANGGALRGFVELAGIDIEKRPGRPATSDHVLVQLSSGSTGPSKVIGRTVSSLRAELDRFSRMDGVPLDGERLVLLSSMVHVLGLVGGLMFGLHAGAQVILPSRMTGDGIVRAIAADARPTTVIGVPFHVELLTSVVDPPALRHLRRLTTGGELVRPKVAESYLDHFPGHLGTMYGMTETGVIAEDLFGQHRPALRPTPGMRLREVGGELQVHTDRTPYLGDVDPTRWADGWLSTKDAGNIDAATGLVTVLGRLDAQVSIGGLKVDLMEVEQVVSALPGVTEAVLVFDRGIEAYVAVEKPVTGPSVREALSTLLAPYKRPTRVTVVAKLPRTVTGKLVRDVSVLREAAA
jgi:acyl-coenzyme A synthetase/AMP-(fatty) acid ligase